MAGVLLQAALDKLARGAYHLLGLQSYYTAGPKEIRAWTIRQGTKAPQAAGVIHTDFERGFIRAEVVPEAELREVGSLAGCRQKGTLRLEGKTYKVLDGEVVHFRFNV